MTRLVVAREAELDRDAILNYLEQEAGARTAAAYAERFARTVERLCDFPGSGAPRPSLGAHTRVAIVYPYLLIYDYEQDTNTLLLMRIVHGRRRISRRLLNR